MLDTLSFNARHLVDVCKFQFMAPYKDSDIYEFCKQKDLLMEGYGKQKISDRFSINIKHNPKEIAFLEKFFDIGHWYMNLFAPLGLEEYYRPLIEEIEKIAFGKWDEKMDYYLKKDMELDKFLSDSKKLHYAFLFKGKITRKVINPTKLFKGKIAGKAIGLTKFDN
jgi:hypothetical protein